MANQNFTHKLWSSRVNYDAANFIGETGRLFYDELTGTLRISDGKTVGGIPITSGGGSGGGGQAYDQLLNTTNNVSFNSVGTSNITASNGLEIKTPYNSQQNIDIHTFYTGTGLSGGIDIKLVHNQGLVIKTHDNTYVWEFDDSGALNFPTTANVTSGTIKINDANSEMSVGTSTGNITIKPSNKKWLFDTSGNITLPLNGSINDNTGVTIIKKEPNFESKNVNFNALSGHRYGIDTTNGVITATLPANPVTGDSIFFIDMGGSFSTNNFLLNRNGKPIMNETSNLSVSVDGQSFGLAWSGTTWRVY